MKIGGRIQRMLNDPASTDLAQLWVLTPHAAKIRYQLLNPAIGLVMESSYRDANESVTLLRIVDGEVETLKAFIHSLYPNEYVFHCVRRTGHQLYAVLDGELNYHSIKWQPPNVPIQPIDWDHQLALYKRQLLIKLISE